MSYRTKCRDCGTPDYKCERSKRADVCDDCWDLRGKLIPAVQAGRISVPEFQALQKTIANSNSSGRGARAMREALGLSTDSP